ncbi:hypothetical protein CEXT_639151 [Caerostris extrusa]|uniref:Uncharacterized protein n=1 Tax=Caerostris extrusa TaxID=172846 RepID=A0AAV4WQ06_CAEEX|nr:hypothetical protein CEXT_639151 [Caerostris extrusa]
MLDARAGRSALFCEESRRGKSDRGGRPRKSSLPSPPRSRRLRNPIPQKNPSSTKFGRRIDTLQVTKVFGHVLLFGKVHIGVLLFKILKGVQKYCKSKSTPFMNQDDFRWTNTRPDVRPLTLEVKVTLPKGWPEVFSVDVTRIAVSI